MGNFRETVEAVKERCDVAQIIGEKVSLTRSGADYKGLCPFHQEKTPSFIVSPAKRMFKCFGCGEGGSVIDFVMTYDRQTFAEAVASLAQRIGLDLDHAGGRKAPDAAPRLLETAQAYYHQRLMDEAGGRTARDYLTRRGFDEQDWKAFSLGYAPAEWQSLTDHAAAASFQQDTMLASGLIRASDNGRLYDFMRNRVLFPILDAQSHCIGFGGRAMSDEDQPKYLNTPETPYYQKHRVLFGMAQGGEAIRKSRRAIICEGYLDVIRLHRAGFSEAVATCGTALTAQHLQTLGRYADRALLVFDGDNAGIKAALRSASIFLDSTLEAHVVALPDGQDPDDFIKQRGTEQGAAAFNELLDRAMPLLEYVVEQTLKLHGSTLHGKQKSLEYLVPILSGIKKETARDITLAHVAHLLEMPIDSVARALKTKRANINPRPPAPSAGESTRPQPPQGELPASPALKESLQQRRMLTYLLRERELIGLARSLVAPDELTDPDVRRVFEKLTRLTDEEFRGLDAEELVWMFPELKSQLQGYLLDEPLRTDTVENYEGAWRYTVKCIKLDRKKRLREQLRKAAGTPEEDNALKQVLLVEDQIVQLNAMRIPPDSS